MLNDHWFGLMRGQFEDCFCTMQNSACEQCRSSFVWADAADVVHQNWVDMSEPGNQDCIRFTYNGWADEDCFTVLRFFCAQGTVKPLLYEYVYSSTQDTDSYVLVCCGVQRTVDGLLEYGLTV